MSPSFQRETPMGKRELSRHVLHALERCGAILLAALIGLLLFATLRAQLARAAEFPTDSGAGTLSFASAGGHEAAAPLSTDIRISVAGIVARVTVAQRFRNTGATTVEALYTLPLPDDRAERHQPSPDRLPAARHCRESAQPVGYDH
jgi:hypothetical protein